MLFRFPRSSFHGGRIIDAYSPDSLAADEDQPDDPTSVRFRSIAEILLRGIQRCVTANRDFGDESSEISALDEPVLGNLGDSLPEPLDFVSDNHAKILLKEIMKYFLDTSRNQHQLSHPAVASLMGQPVLV